MSILNEVFLSSSFEYQRVWDLSLSGQFSCKLAFQLLVIPVNSFPSFSASNIWFLFIY